MLRPERRPDGGGTRFHQFLACAVANDAVTNHAIAIGKLLRQRDPRTRIWAEAYDAAFEDRVAHYPWYEDVARGDDVCLWHASSDSEIAPFLATRGENLAVFYHNITPSELIRPFDPRLADRLDLARRQTAALASRCRVALCGSEYSAGELVEWGYPRPHVVGLYLDESRYEISPDPDLYARLVREKGDGPAVLFVGRLSPNKGQAHLLAALRELRKIHPDARLWLVGTEHVRSYTEMLEELVDEYGLGPGIFAGKVGQEELVAYMKAADIFCSLSEHEGFGIPLLEAMKFSLPVVAYDSSAVRETLDGGGMLLDSLDPVSVAEALGWVYADASLRSRLIEAGRARLARLGDRETAEAQLVELVASADPGWLPPTY